MANNKLFKKYTDEYLEKVFYFCLKKCSNPIQAEDLASEINYNILKALNRDFMPHHLNAWIWAVARNQYSKWATQTRKTRRNVFPNDVGDYEIASEDSVEDNVIQSEQINILHRELAFVAKEYREILIAYYINGKKTEDIAKSLHLPKGTVVSKLHRIRKKLKEGFEMSREFGVLSYKPENVGFIMNGKEGRDGAPWCFLSRLIAKNIILAAYRNPMRAKELAIEMGIALPYMEDELSKLVYSTLMKKNGDKYETAIFIVSAKAQERCYDHLASIVSELTDLVIKTVEYQVKCYEQNDIKWHEGYQSFEDMKWTLLMQQIDHLRHNVISKHKLEHNYTNIGIYGQSIRPDNGQWDLMGLEDCNIQRPPFIGLHGCGETPDISNSGYNYQFYQYKFLYEHINEKTPIMLSNEQCRALVDCVRQTPENSPAILLDELAGYGYLKNDNERYCPTFFVQFGDKLRELTEDQKSIYQKLTIPAIELLDSHYMVCRESVMEEVPLFLREDEYQINHTIANIMLTRESVFKEALDIGWITYDSTDPESAKHRMLGAYLGII